MSDKFKESFNQKQTLIPYITFGDPSIEFTEELCEGVFSSGADIIELGLPFSDPIADGPVIQQSHQRALLKKADVTIKHAFSMVKRVKQNHKKPIIFMSTVNLILQYGVEEFFKDAAQNTLDGIVIPDLSIEAASQYLKQSKKAGVPIIFLISPLCDDLRLKRIVDASEGFVYLISNTGITGERDSISTSLTKIIKKIKKIKDIPVAIGFGISTPEHVKLVNKIADGAIVGSHLIKIINQNSSRVAVAKQEFLARVSQLKQ